MILFVFISNKASQSPTNRKEEGGYIRNCMLCKDPTVGLFPNILNNNVMSQRRRMRLLLSQKHAIIFKKKKKKKKRGEKKECACYAG